VRALFATTYSEGTSRRWRTCISVLLTRRVGRGLLLAGLLWAPLSSAPAAEYHVDTAAANQVRFISDAPIEDFDGKTRHIDGYVYWKGDSLAIGSDYLESDVYFEVELDLLDTGIRLRNRHMRENYLETEKFPYAFYRGRITAVEALPSGGWRVASKGKLGIHGVEKEFTIQCDLSDYGTGYRVKSAFQVQLPDFHIKVPSLMFMKISETINLELDFYVRQAETK